MKVASFACGAAWSSNKCLADQIIGSNLVCFLLCVVELVGRCDSGRRLARCVQRPQHATQERCGSADGKRAASNGTVGVGWHRPGDCRGTGCARQGTWQPSMVEAACHLGEALGCQRRWHEQLCWPWANKTSERVRGVDVDKRIECKANGTEQEQDQLAIESKRTSLGSKSLARSVDAI